MYRPWCLLYLAFCFSLAVYGSAAQTPNRDVLQINAPHSGVFKMVYVAIGDIVGPSHELAVLEYEERETVQMSIHAPDSGERGRKYKVLDLWNFGEEVTTGTPLLKLESIYT